MPLRSWLAFDLGASSGRALLGELRDERLTVREIGRFANQIMRVNGRECWNLYHLYDEMKSLLCRAVASLNEPPAALGIDTWGVDFALLDRAGDILGLPVAYRDKRTAGAMASFFARLPRERLYALTGIQMLPINTLFQLEAMVRDASPLLEIAADLLFMPDLFHYLLTGEKRTEFTFATTSQLYNPLTREWDNDIFAALGLDRGMMQEVIEPGTTIGPLTAALAAELGLPRLPVVAVATHDTGSAVAAAPAEGDDWAFLSSGTWSLLGVEVMQPILTGTAREANFTNEGGVGGTFRFLKNIMGLWLLQSCRREWAADREWTWDELAIRAEAAAPFAALIDPDDPSFLNPPDMGEAIGDFCRRTGQPAPESVGATVRCILESLALKTRHALEQLRQARPGPLNRLHIIGGGSRNRLLNQMIADANGLEVLTGPVEATAIGNLLVQALATGAIGSPAEARAVARRSFPPERIEPRHAERWEEPWRRFQELVAQSEKE